MEKKPNYIKLIFAGAFVGIGAMLPGISGGMLCLIFGIYQVIIETMANPIKNIFKNIKIIIPVGIGGIIGVLAAATLLDYLFVSYEKYVLAAFAGLTIGMLPATFKEALKYGKTKKSVLVFFISLFVACVLLGVFRYLSITLTGNIWTYFLCGIIWGTSIIVPGMGSSTFITFLGLYDKMSAGIKNFDMGVLIPMGLGIIIILLLFSKLVNYLLKNYYTNFYSLILGTVIASIIFIMPYNFTSFVDFIIQASLVIGGILFSYFLDFFMQKLSNQKDVE